MQYACNDDDFDSDTFSHGYDTMEHRKIRREKRREADYVTPYTVVDDVLEKEHTLSKQVLDVKRYQECLGRPGEEVDEKVLRLPEDLFVDKNASVITVVGNKNVAEDLSTKVENMTKEVMAEVEKEREKIKETITSFKNIETRILLADKFPTDMKKLFPDLKVKINQNKNEILFEGPLGQVRDAKLKMNELKARFAVDRSQEISELAAGLLVLNQTKEHVVKKLNASRATAVWDIVEGYLVVYCTNQDQIQLCVNVIRSSVIEHTVALKKAAKTLVNSEKWQTKVDDLHVYHAGKCMIKVSADSCKVQICATDDIANEILDNVKTFLRQNTVVEAKVPCTRNVHRLIERHHKNEISSIAKGLTNYNVQISSVADYGGFEVCGTEDGLHQAVQQLHQLLLKVKQKEHVMTKPGLSKHMQTPRGKVNLNTMHQCVVAVKGDNDEDEINDNPYDTVPIDSDVRHNIGVKGVKIVAYSKVYDCRNVYTMQGDMTELTVDMIVNSADDKLNLTGGLGNAIVNKGGKGIQKECADYIRDNNRLDDGDAFVSTAGSLKASAIVHVRGPVWRGGMNQEDEMLKEAVFKCLQQASTRNLTSVAIPALSWGTYGYPVRIATTVIVAAVKNFFRKDQESTVTNIYLCDMKTNTVEAFNEAMSNEFGATNVKKYVDNLDSMRQPSKRFSRADSDDENPYIKPIDTDEEDDDYYISSSILAQPSGKAPRLPKGRPPQKTTKIGNISISVVKGEIAKQKVDVIVNTTAKNLDLNNGAVSASLLKTGGMELQQEVSKKYPNGIKAGEIAVTSGQSLKCDIVVHCSLANWDRKKDAQCKQALHKLMKDCMDEADNKGKTSIAFPAIGTGNLGFPCDIVATEMFSAVSKFSNSNSSSSLREVSFIVYEKDFQTIQAFEDEARRWSTGKRCATGGIEGRQYDLYQDLPDEEEKLLSDKVRIMKSVMFLRDQDMLENMMDVLSRKFLFTRRWNYLRVYRKRNADILISMVLTSPKVLLKGFTQYLQDHGYDDIQTMIDSKSVTLKDITVLSEQEESSSRWRFGQTIGKPLLNFTYKQKRFLLEELENANDIAASLLSKMIISGKEFLKISLQPARRRGITVLLDILENCPEKHLVDFYSALEENGYNYMTDELVMIKQGQFDNVPDYLSGGYDEYTSRYQPIFTPGNFEYYPFGTYGRYEPAAISSEKQTSQTVNERGETFEAIRNKPNPASNSETESGYSEQDLDFDDIDELM